MYLNVPSGIGIPSGGTSQAGAHLRTPRDARLPPTAVGVGADRSTEPPILNDPTVVRGDSQLQGLGYFDRLLPG